MADNVKASLIFEDQSARLRCLNRKETMIQKFSKKPVVIEAVQWVGTNIDEVMEFLNWRNASYDDREGLRIHTLEGTHHATVADFIIKGVKGEFYPCKPDIFSATYEAVQALQCLSILKRATAYSNA